MRGFFLLQTPRLQGIQIFKYHKANKQKQMKHYTSPVDIRPKVITMN